MAALRQPAWPSRVRFVGWAAIAAAVCVFSWMGATSPPSLNRPRAVPVDEIASELAMHAPHISGRLQDGRTYHVSAQRATMTPGDDRIMRLSAVRGDLKMRDGGEVAISAIRARYDRTREHMTLEGDVTLTRTDGYMLKTEAAEVWRAPDGIAAKSDRPTEISGPGGHARAAGVTVAPGLTTARLLGPVSVRLNEEPQQ